MHAAGQVCQRQCFPKMCLRRLFADRYQAPCGAAKFILELFLLLPADDERLYGVFINVSPNAGTVRKRERSCLVSPCGVGRVTQFVRKSALELLQICW